MCSRDMKDLEGPAELLDLLETSNLMSYKNALLEQGADDVNQLVGLTAEEFQQLCSMIGMDKKPFHVLRFRKALQNRSRATRKSPESTHSRHMPMNQGITSTVFSSNKGISQRGPPPLVKTPSQELVRQLPHESKARDQSISSLRHHSGTKSTLLLAHQTPVQMTFNPCYYVPESWDSHRKANSFPKEGIGKQQSQFLVNESGCQLYSQDPNLLVKSDHLFLLPQKMVNPGSYPHCVVPNYPSLISKKSTGPLMIESPPSQDPLLLKRTNDNVGDRIHANDSLPAVGRMRPFEMKPSSAVQLSPITQTPKHSHTDFITTHSSAQHTTSDNVGQSVALVESSSPVQGTVLSKRVMRPGHYYATNDSSLAFEKSGETKQSYQVPYYSHVTARNDSRPVVGRKRLIETVSSPVQSTPTVPINPVQVRRSMPGQTVDYQIGLPDTEVEAERVGQNLPPVVMARPKRIRHSRSTSAVLEEQVEGLEEELNELERTYRLSTPRQAQSGHYDSGNCFNDKTGSGTFQTGLLSPISPLTPTTPITIEPGIFQCSPLQRQKDKVSSKKPRGKVSLDKKRVTFPRKTSKVKQQPPPVDPSPAEIKELMDNVTNATDKLNSLLNGAKMVW